MGLGGYFGRYLRIDLERETALPIALEEDALLAVIGGVGLGALLLSRETFGPFDPLGPEAPLILAFGPLVGTPLTTSAKVAFVAKSPLTNRISDGLSSSSFAIAAKRTGFDALVLVGARKTPSLVLIENERVSLLPCEDLWGKDQSISETDKNLKEVFPDHHFVITGIAGEHRVRYAGLANNGRHAGRGGLGAVLGAKFVKAIGVRGNRDVPLASPNKTIQIAKDLARRSLGPGTEKYRVLGTVANLATLNRLSALPTKNFQSGTFENAKLIEGESLHQNREKARSSCQNCTIGCEHFYEVRPGEKLVKMEYENLFALGPLCGISDPEIVLRASSTCDELGLDTISAGGTIAFAMECNERALLPKGPLAEEARDLGFGDGARMLRLLHQIARKQTPLTSLLAEGSRIAAEAFGPNTRALAPHVKGLEIPGYEPRAMQTMALGFAVSARGADHNRSSAYEADLSGEVDRLHAGPNAVDQAIQAEDRAAVMDSLILCKFLRRALSDLYEDAAEMLRAVTGLSFETDTLKQAATRVVLLRRAFNETQGYTAEEDTLPARFFDEALPSGAAKGVALNREHFNALVKAYYNARGLSPEGRVPNDMRERLRKLG